MTLTKCSEWPKVLPDDDGIRPAGEPDRCLYCGARIGEPHGRDCVVVTKLVRYAVLMDGQKVGVYRRYDPHSWDTQQMEFHKNEGSWCTDNAIEDGIEWVSPEARGRVEAAMGDHCACNVLKFRMEAVEDDGPFVKLRDRMHLNKQKGLP
jgi:hypothetical protein